MQMLPCKDELEMAFDYEKNLKLKTATSGDKRNTTEAIKLNQMR